MTFPRILASAFLAASLFYCAQPVAAQPVNIILRGKVVMDDGSAVTSASVERICDDLLGTTSGPLVDKRGTYTLRVEFDPFASRHCHIQASHAGFDSSTFDISNLDSTKANVEVPNLVLSVHKRNPYAILVRPEEVPSKSLKTWEAVGKAFNHDNAEVVRQLKVLTEASPKWAPGWHSLGVIQDRQGKQMEAKDSYEHAIAADPKFLPPYDTLAQLQMKMKDWDGAAKTIDLLIKADAKHEYPDMYLHRAVVRYELKDLDGAATAAQEAIQKRNFRGEYVLGRVLEAKGDTNGAKEHMSKYLELEPRTSDGDAVKAHIANLGKPEASANEPQLEILNFGNPSVVGPAPGAATPTPGATTSSAPAGPTPEQLAEEARVRAQQEKNKDLTAAFDAGKAAQAAGQWDEAIDSFTKASKIDPKQSVTFARLGAVYTARSSTPGKPLDERQADDEQAVASYAKAVELKDDSADYHNNYGVALGRLRKVPEAEAQLAKAAELDPPGAGKYFYNLGSIYVNAAQNDPAEKAFKKAIDADPNYAEAHYQYGIMLMGRATVVGDKITAPSGTTEAFQKYLQLKPDGANAESAKAMLQALGSKVQTDFSRKPAAAPAKKPPTK